MELIGYIGIGVGGLIAYYILLRTGSFAIFKSWFDAKHQNGERRNVDERNKVDN